MSFIVRRAAKSSSRPSSMWRGVLIAGTLAHCCWADDGGGGGCANGRWENHERSKKHLERVAQLRSELEEDDLLAEAASEESHPETVAAAPPPPPESDPMPTPAPTVDTTSALRKDDRGEDDDGGSDEDGGDTEEDLLAKLAAGIRLEVGARRSGRSRVTGDGKLDNDDDDDNWDSSGRQSAAAKVRANPPCLHLHQKGSHVGT